MDNRDFYSEPVSQTIVVNGESSNDELLTGTQFDNISPYVGNPDLDGHAAFDGDVGTYVDAASASGAYTGIELDNPASLTMIRYYPRDFYAGAERMVGGIFQGSNDGVNYVDLHTISTEPAYNWNEVVLTTEAYSYYRYMSAPDGYCNVAEIEFWGSSNDIPVVNYTLAVNNGSGSGDYTKSTVVNIEADAASSGQQFAQWTGDVAYIANVNSASTTLTMPAVDITVTATYEDAPDQVLLSGTQFDNVNPYQGNNAVDGQAAFDENVNSYVDAWAANGAYTGIELDNPASLSMIRYYPRESWAGRMVGGIFQGSNDGVNYVDLHTISTEPAYNWNEVVLTTEAYSYYRYMSAPDGYCNVAEIEFWGSYNQLKSLGTSSDVAVNQFKGFTIYPNPVNQFIHVSCSQTDGVKKIGIIDVSGKVLLERSMQSNNFTLSVGHLEEGMYIIRVMSGKKMYSQKLYVTE